MDEKEYEGLVDKVACVLFEQVYKNRSWEKLTGDTLRGHYTKRATKVLEAIGITRPEPTLGVVARRAWLGKAASTFETEQRDERWEKVAAAVIDAYEGRSSVS